MMYGDYVYLHLLWIIDFEAMKKMKISYLLSKQKLFHENFQIICETCNDNKDLNLYLLK